MGVVTWWRGDDVTWWRGDVVTMRGAWRTNLRCAMFYGMCYGLINHFIRIMKSLSGLKS